MNCKKRIGAFLLCVVFVLIMLVSSVYTIHEAGHDCSGEDCPICQMIAVNSQLLRLIGAAVLLLVSLMGILRTGLVLHDTHKHSVPVLGTLVNRKIRLNN